MVNRLKQWDPNKPYIRVTKQVDLKLKRLAEGEMWKNWNLTDAVGWAEVVFAKGSRLDALRRSSKTHNHCLLSHMLDEEFRFLTWAKDVRSLQREMQGRMDEKQEMLEGMQAMNDPREMEPQQTEGKKLEHEGTEQENDAEKEEIWKSIEDGDALFKSFESETQSSEEQLDDQVEAQCQAKDEQKESVEMEREEIEAESKEKVVELYTCWQSESEDDSEIQVSKDLKVKTKNYQKLLDPQEVQKYFRVEDPNRVQVLFKFMKGKSLSESVKPEEKLWKSGADAEDKAEKQSEKEEGSYERKNLVEDDDNVVKGGSDKKEKVLSERQEEHDSSLWQSDSSDVEDGIAPNKAKITELPDHISKIFSPNPKERELDAACKSKGGKEAIEEVKHKMRTMLYWDYVAETPPCPPFSRRVHFQEVSHAREA